MIISVSELRKYIATDEADDILEKRLSGIESLIRNYTHNNFQQRSVRSQSEILDGVILNPPENISVGDTVQVSDSLLNNGVYTVTGIDNTGMTLSGSLYDCTKNLVTRVVYPPDVIMGAVNLMKWELENREKVGIQSETLSRHSVTYFSMDSDNTLMGYPVSLMGFLKPYMKARF
ncbi:MAG: hypothetical protein ACI4JB_04730 [Porcipelethomonas sp.]